MLRFRIFNLAVLASLASVPLRALGENSAGSFFMNSPAKELESLRPAFNQMVKTAASPDLSPITHHP